jgi:hypothetical protein
MDRHRTPIVTKRARSSMPPWRATEELETDEIEPVQHHMFGLYALVDSLKQSVDCAQFIAPRAALSARFTNGQKSRTLRERILLSLISLFWQAA